IYSLPSTSRRREPCPLCTNNGYGVQPAHVARAVLLTPPGMTRHAASNNLALPVVLRSAISLSLDIDVSLVFEFVIRLRGNDVIGKSRLKPRPQTRRLRRASRRRVFRSAASAASPARRRNLRSRR